MANTEYVCPQCGQRMDADVVDRRIGGSVRVTGVVLCTAGAHFPHEVTMNRVPKADTHRVTRRRPGD